MRTTRYPVAEVFFAFLRLGCTSFGGPIAHLGYFERELVARRKWCSPETYAEIVALAQTLPGPASSQAGFALGLLRAGPLGGLAAFVGFTLPSALLMLAFALASTRGHNPLTHPATTRALHGLMLVAVAVVAQAAVGMQRSLAPDLRRLAIAACAAATVLLLPGSFITLLAIALGATLGLRLPSTTEPAAGHASPSTRSKRSAALFFTFFAVLLLSSVSEAAHLAPGIKSTHPLATLAAAFYRTGALVFGGGQVVLPLLESTLVAPGWVSQSTFLSGYGTAQAMPGPLFSVAAYLGATADPTHPIAAALTALLALFAPGLLLMFAALPVWTTLRNISTLRSALRGINAAVVGILFAALIHPLATSALRTPLDLTVALSAFLLLTLSRTPPWQIVLLTATACALL